ncbi:uncharacterized protein BDR25DRAFT_357688 [Lindgomyces ingoldianus]|uniref:Uncharacterized protein n=1 Tax=Lindgomyces ingoldianus TaxID=673940 RepID=A0ACB6QMY0_9PLEO|nr:uncharacterized protein BDR25DRAFT_357688 [Lindgomyces ingoldianus]KAF2468374.1 hypothetical protein BDR25DRAFT_357688 [Lindgomyces ingoldianus]
MQHRASEPANGAAVSYDVLNKGQNELWKWAQLQGSSVSYKQPWRQVITVSIVLQNPNEFVVAARQSFYHSFNLTVRQGCAAAAGRVPSRTDKTLVGMRKLAVVHSREPAESVSHCTVLGQKSVPMNRARNTKTRDAHKQPHFPPPPTPP